MSLRHFLGARFRSLLVVLGIALGVALHVANDAASRSVSAAFADFVARVSDRADLTIGGGGESVPGELVAEVAETPGVAHAAAALEVTARAEELGESLLVLGVDLLGDTHFLPFEPAEGAANVVDDPLVFVNDPSALLLSRSFAERHGLRAGSTLRLLTAEGPKDFHVRGLVEDRGAAASFGGQVAVMFLDAAQVAFARGTMVDRIDVALEPGADARAVQEQLQQLAGAGISVETANRLGARLRVLGEPLQALLLVSSLLALCAAAFLVYNAVAVAVAQRRREIGLLRALGVTRRGVTLLFCSEAFFMALPGALLGLLLGHALSRYSSGQALATIERLYLAATQVALDFDPWFAARAAAAGIGMAVVAAFLPARRAAAIDPAPTLRASAAEPPRFRLLPVLLAASALCAVLAVAAVLRGTWNGAAAGVVLSVLAGVLATPALIVAIRALLARPLAAGFGLPARFGLDYVVRTLGRSSLNVLALMVAVGTSVASGGWLSAIERSITRWAEQVGVADLTVTQGSPLLDRRHVPMPAEAAERVERVPGVRRIQRTRLLDRQVQNTALRLVAVDLDVFLEESERRGKGWQVLDGTLPRPGELARSPALVVSENAAHRLGLHAGGSLRLSTREGEVEFAIRAVVVDYTSPSGAAFLDHRQFVQHFGDQYLDGIFVYLEPSADPDAVARGIRAELDAAAGGAVFVSQTQALERHILDSLRETFSYSRSVELMILLIALMGVIGTMTAAVIDRRRELAILRAVGASTRQVAATIVIESGFLGLCAAVIGIGVGVVECMIMLDMLMVMETGWHIEFSFPWQAAGRTLSWVVATSALAGALPALRAARGSPIPATPE